MLPARTPYDVSSRLGKRYVNSLLGEYLGNVDASVDQRREGCIIGERADSEMGSRITTIQMRATSTSIVG
jgi:hypothetical protein